MSYKQPSSRPGATQNVAYTGTAGVVSNGVSDGVFQVRVNCSTDAYIAFGAAPTATTSDIFMAAGRPEYFTVSPGQKVSAVQASSGGTLSVSEMT
jgi:hypothetical protein